jgi:ectoine hydroxylase-related dioxygenase (phytanoyl-CoA dioxygenase family)
MSAINPRHTSWLPRLVETVSRAGYAIVAPVFDESFLDAVREAMYRAQRSIIADIGQPRLDRAGELGVLRLMLKYDPLFLRFLEHDDMLAVVDAVLDSTAVMHLQNGFILPSFPSGQAPEVFQRRFHMDFPRVLNGYVMSVNVLVAIDPFTAENGGTLVAPGTHQSSVPPSIEALESRAVPVECPAGGLVVFDSTLWHAAGPNTSGRDRLGVNHQFTRSYLKQQIDYVRALGDTVVLAQKPRTQQLLGWYTRVPTSLDEYYRPEADRLYRKHQG